MGLIIEKALQHGVAAHNAGNLQEAKRAYQTILQSQPKHPDANYNLGLIAISVNQIEAALSLFRTALDVNPNIEKFWISYVDALVKNNQLKDAKRVVKKAKKKGFGTQKLQVLLSQSKNAASAKAPSQELLNGLLKLLQNGRLTEAERLATTISQEFPQHQFAWKVLGVALQEKESKFQALDANQKAVALSPQDAEAHNNLGITLQKLERLDEAEASCRQAIELKTDLVEAHNNLGAILLKLGRLDEAEASCRQAIALKPDYAEAHYNLGTVLYAFGDKNSALISIERANVLKPESKHFSLLLKVLQARKAWINSEASVDNITTADCIAIRSSKILLLKRLVEPELTAYLYRTELVDLNKRRDPSFGNTRGSKYDLFEDNHPTIQRLAADLKSILIKVFKSDIFIMDSFFSIFRAGGGTARHQHLTEFDKDSTFNLGEQKYSLVYYLSIGDQECSDPGYLNFYEPSEEILPSKGLITVFPSDRDHSSVYGGNEDRVIIGVNFYTLL